MSFSRAAALAHLARAKGLQSLEHTFLSEQYLRIGVAALGAFGVLLITAAIMAAIN